MNFSRTMPYPLKGRFSTQRIFQPTFDGSATECSILNLAEAISGPRLTAFFDHGQLTGYCGLSPELGILRNARSSPVWRPGIRSSGRFENGRVCFEPGAACGSKSYNAPVFAWSSGDCWRNQPRGRVAGDDVHHLRRSSLGSHSGILKIRAHFFLDSS